MTVNTTRCFLLALFSIFSRPTVADVDWSVGSGIQYGGIFGTKASYIFEQYKISGSVGLPGAALGVERVIGSRYSVGLQTFLVGLTTGWGVYANYNIISRRGKWIAGIDWIVYSNTNELTFYTEDSNGQNYALLSVGYEFE